MRLNVDSGNSILRAFLDGDRDDIALLFRVVMRIRTDDMEIGIAVLEIEAADEIEVGGDLVRIVDVGGLEE